MSHYNNFYLNFLIILFYNVMYFYNNFTYIYMSLMLRRFAFACFVQDHAFWQNTNGEHNIIFTNFIIHIHSMLNYYVFVTISLFTHFYICKHD